MDWTEPDNQPTQPQEAAVLGGYLDIKTNGAFWNFRNYDPYHKDAGEGIEALAAAGHLHDEDVHDVSSGTRGSSSGKDARASIEGELSTLEGRVNERRKVAGAHGFDRSRVCNTDETQAEPLPVPSRSKLTTTAREQEADALLPLTSHFARFAWESCRPEMDGKAIFRHIETIEWNATGKEFEESIMDLEFFHQALCTLYGDYAPPFEVLYKAKATYHSGGFDRFRLVPELVKWNEEHQLRLYMVLNQASKSEIATDTFGHLSQQKMRGVARDLQKTYAEDVDSDSD